MVLVAAAVVVVAVAVVAAVLAKLGDHITLVRIPGSDHYFADRLDELRAAVRGYYESGPGAELLANVWGYCFASPTWDGPSLTTRGGRRGSQPTTACWSSRSWRSG